MFPASRTTAGGGEFCGSGSGSSMAHATASSSIFGGSPRSSAFRPPKAVRSRSARRIASSPCGFVASAASSSLTVRG
jgi:hypothetical protein